MDWFEQITGFRELGYKETRERLEIIDGKLRSKVNDQSYGVGELELASLQDLRERVKTEAQTQGRLSLRIIRGDIRKLHRLPENSGALFQVASQFNLLEMTSPMITPEDGVTRYETDGTQGPACSIAAGAATIYRNYFAQVGDQLGQTSQRQLDGLDDLGQALSTSLNCPVHSLWDMQNGYAMCTAEGLDKISVHLASLDKEATDALRGLLRIGLHTEVEVTDQSERGAQYVSQAFCSALPLAYSSGQVQDVRWASFATLILEAAYEATLWAAVLNAKRTGSNIVLLTQLGGGVFGNSKNWIDTAMRRALSLASQFDLDVRLVSYGSPSEELLKLEADFA